MMELLATVGALGIIASIICAILKAAEYIYYLENEISILRNWRRTLHDNIESLREKLREIEKRQ